MGPTVGLSKVFILDKYFTELQKFWETERKLQDASTSNEAVHLQQRLRNLSSELVTLRTRLHPGSGQTQSNPASGGAPNASPATAPVGVINGQPSAPYLSQEICHRSGGVTTGPEMPAVTRTCDNILAETEDLIHLLGPLTEDAVLRTLHARFFASEYFINVGPVLLSVNSYQNVGNPLTLSSTHQEASRYPALLRVVQEAVRQQSETGYPQAIILSGESGSGKTYSSMILLRQLFDVAGGGSETDAFKHLSAAFTVLRSLGSAKIATNSESSRIGHFIEVQYTDGALYRTKIHCYFLDQTRVVKPLQNEKNFHIFYQMLAGLTKEERVKLNLDGYNQHNLKYLSCGDVNQNETEDGARFEAWKSCLSVLGIPFMDVVRVLAAVLLLGNVPFNENSANGGQMACDPGLNSCDAKSNYNSEIKAVASLLGVSSVALFRGLTTRTHHVRGQLVKSVSDGATASATRDALAKALYCRTVATIVRRANSLKRIGSTCGTLSSDSNESVHNHIETGSHHASTIGSNGAKSHKSLNVLNSAVRRVTDGFIGILDMFGFEDSKPSHLEQLCINLCAETMQHFYNTHIFKSSIESCREEGVRSDIEVDYVDNVPCIDFISSLRTGLLSMLDVESSLRGTPERYVAKIKAQHKGNSRYFPVNAGKSFSGTSGTVGGDSSDQVESHAHNSQHYIQYPPKGQQQPGSRMFGIRHFAGNVVYDAGNFLSANRDVVSDDIVVGFHKTSCTFGFATHLFGMELKTLFSQDGAPRGLSFRISPTSHTDLQKGSDPVSTLTQDFHTRLDNLLRTLVHARPHFIRCLKPNNSERANRFDRKVVIRQVRSLQVLETVNLMAGGLPHRLRFRAFNSRYRCLAPFKRLKRTEEKVIEDCKLILDCFVATLEDIQNITSASTCWAQGKRHMFLSEEARQQLEMLRTAKRNSASLLIQSAWRGWQLRKQWPTLKRNLVAERLAHRQANPSALTNGVGSRPRPQPITGTPPPEVCDQKIIQQTCTLFGLDLEHPPPIPPSRSYTVAGNAKLGYPQSRVMKMDYPEEGGGGGSEIQLRKGSTVLVVGASGKRGHLLVDHNDLTLHVPYQFMELRSSNQEEDEEEDESEESVPNVPGVSI